jgi:oligoribonuclease
VTPPTTPPAGRDTPAGPVAPSNPSGAARERLAGLGGFPKWVAWIDVETTGLDPDRCGLLEVAVVVTGWDLGIVDEATWLVDPGPGVRWDVAAEAMHEATGLRRPGGDPPTVVDRRLSAFLDPLGGPVALAGSGVGHFDDVWITKHLPATARRLTYWSIDVGVVRRFLALVVGIDVEPPTPNRLHRAHADALDALAEARHYRDVLARALAPHAPTTGRDDDD